MVVFKINDYHNSDVKITRRKVTWLGKSCTVWEVIGPIAERVESVSNRIMTISNEAVFESPRLIGDTASLNTARSLAAMTRYDAALGKALSNFIQRGEKYRTRGYTVDVKLTDKQSAKLRQVWLKLNKESKQ